MDGSRARIVEWVGREVMPHEHGVRLWLQRARVPAEDADDLIQEAYCRLSRLDAVDHITRPDSYFFQIVRNLLVEQRRRAQVVPIEAAGDIDRWLGVDDLSPERIAIGRREMERVRSLIAQLPDRCRRIFELRKIDGVPQQEIARIMGVSESVVENDGVKGLRLIMRSLREDAAQSDRKMDKSDERPRNRR